jgi:hypothetical protein
MPIEHETPPVAETMVEDLPMMMAGPTSDAPAEKEALPKPELPTA